MNPIELRRAMSRRGWSYSRRKRGEAVFGIRFPSGKGATKVVSLEAISLLNLSVRGLANYLTVSAAYSAGFDPRSCRDAGQLEL